MLTSANSIGHIGRRSRMGGWTLKTRRINRGMRERTSRSFSSAASVCGCVLERRVFTPRMAPVWHRAKGMSYRRRNHSKHPPVHILLIIRMFRHDLRHALHLSYSGTSCSQSADRKGYEEDMLPLVASDTHSRFALLSDADRRFSHRRRSWRAAH
ncbi:hypothetical protein NUW54_g13141 [Trametes sanguinea]|uniref:Uncharacterized protein n=1 Tax=Trametes sanguinea TaxID=158606 RepID=A0ACC1MPC9_9APHY|nr:hypothetical protein NUW54_g13141 [Trametes sanguinea]